MKTKKQLKEEQREEEIEQKYENIIECLLILATKDKKIVTMTQFLEILKENYNLKFDIRGSKYNGIYHFLGDISQEFIDENIPNITTIIDFKNELKPFYRLIDTSHIDDFEEEKKFLKKYPNGEEILKNERKKIFEFDWKNWFEILESNEKENEEKIANEINFDLNQEIKLSDIKDKEQKEYTAEVNVYYRDSNVKRKVLKRANGICEKCNKPAPFIDQNNELFLEVHHIKYLSEDGEDVEENCQALCPNCHRQIHFGK